LAQGPKATFPMDYSHAEVNITSDRATKLVKIPLQYANASFLFLLTFVLQH
jgi:hypothetical protein